MKKLLGVTAATLVGLAWVWWMIWRDWITAMSLEDEGVPEDLVGARAAAMARHPSSQPRVAPPHDIQFPYLVDLEN